MNSKNGSTNSSGTEMTNDKLRAERLKTAYSNLKAVEDDFDSLIKRRMIKEARLQVEQILRDE